MLNMSTGGYQHAVPLVHKMLHLQGSISSPFQIHSMNFPVPKINRISLIRPYKDDRQLNHWVNKQGKNRLFYNMKARLECTQWLIPLHTKVLKFIFEDSNCTPSQISGSITHHQHYSTWQSVVNIFS